MKKITFLLIFCCSFGFAQVGIGNIDPKTALDVTGGLSLREGTALNITAATTNNLSLGTTPSSFYRITGPTTAFNITGLAPTTTSNGQIITLENTTAFNFTISNDNASSIAINRIYCPGGTDLVLSGIYSTVTLSYNAFQTRWIVIGSTDNAYGKNMQSAFAVTDISTNSSTFTPMTGMSVTFTPKHNIVYLNFGASGDMDLSLAADIQGWVKFRAFNVTSNTTIAATTSLTTDYDYDNFYGRSISAAWNAHFSMYPVTVTPGTPVTIRIDWFTGGSYAGTVRCQPTASPQYSHRNLTIFD